MINMRDVIKGIRHIREMDPQEKEQFVDPVDRDRAETLFNKFVEICDEFIGEDKDFLIVLQMLSETFLSFVQVIRDKDGVESKKHTLALLLHLLDTKELFPMEFDEIVLPLVRGEEVKLHG